MGWWSRSGDDNSIASTVLGVLLESWTPFDRPVAKTLAASFFTLMDIIFNRIKIIEHRAYIPG